MSEEDYFEAMFNMKKPIKKKTKQGPTNNQDPIKEALDRAHEIRQFEIQLYWHRSLFFWGFILVLFTGLGLILAAENQTALIKFAAIGIAALGFFTTFAWYYVEKGSKAWMANWELHIDFLEDNITGKLYKTVLCLDEKDDFFSVSKITQTVIIAFGLFWFLASVFVTHNAFLTKELGQGQEQKLLSIMDFFKDCSWLDLFISILLSLFIFIVVSILAYRKKCGPIGYWRTTPETIPNNGEKTGKKEKIVVAAQRPKGKFMRKN